MDLGLNNKNALVTASSRGLGFAMAGELARNGASVAICSRTGSSLSSAVERMKASAPNATIAGYVCDVHDPDSVKQLVANAARDLGGLDILATNAGGPPGGTFDSTTPEDWERGVQLTLMSAVNLIRDALPFLRLSDSASILTITSISVKQPIAGLHLSNVIRPAVVGLTKTLSQELGGEGIRVNSILPGWTATERVEEILAYRASQSGNSIDVERGKISRGIPLGRMGTPEEFGRVAAFLVSPAASYISGAAIQVDGGSYAGLI